MDFERFASPNWLSTTLSASSRSRKPPTNFTDEAETAPAKGVSSRIPRAMHGGAGAAQRQRRPNQLTLVRTRSHTSREEQMLLTEVNARCTQCAGSSEGLKQ